MKAILKSIIATSLLLVTTTASAQHPESIEEQMKKIIDVVMDHQVEVTKSLGQERDIRKEGKPLTWRCDIYTFTLPKKYREHLDEMIEVFETQSRENPNCYGINSMSEASNGDHYANKRNLMIGENPNRYVTIGEDYSNYLNVNLLDDADTTKTHRYAYALEWRSGSKGKTDVRYIITYAKISSATTSLIQQDWPYLKFGQANIIKRKGKPAFIQGNARIQWEDKDYPVQSLDSLLREAEKRTKEGEQRMKETERRLRKKFQTDKSLVLWNDTLEHETDPVTDVVQRLQQGNVVSANDLLCNDLILLVFSQLKQQFLAGQNTEFNAISIYTLCKHAREYGFFTDNNAKQELEQLKKEITTMQNRTTSETNRQYLQMALEELEKIN